MRFMEKLRMAILRKRTTAKIVFLRLDRAGKTTILRRITSGQFDDASIRTLGMNVDEFTLGDISFIVWDVGGQEVFRHALWKDYIRGAMGIVFVIDAADRARFEEAREELWTYVFNSPETKGMPILILGNKQDLPNVADEGELSLSLNLNRIKDRSYRIFLTSAKTGLNIEESLLWLSEEIKKIS